ncbi:MAG: LLM class F420-dependent oxidoreductase [Chloroflexi bacterium]|nr:LLM class F420-dependent oxidoreductase [Chloroflexota bacterium]
MRFGVMLPQQGLKASPEALVRAAQQAERLRYDSVWVNERLLYPVHPRTPYPGSPDGALPATFSRTFTPLETLAYVAAHTSRVALGTGIVNMPLHNPVMLARQLATLDVLSGGRVRVGLGQAWSVDELEAAGADTVQRGPRADEFLAVLKQVWTTDPAEFRGKYFTLPESVLQPKPIQQPHPLIYLGAYAPRALARVGRLADGWLPAGVPLAAMGPMMGQIRETARDAGRDPASLHLVTLAFVSVLPDSPGANRPDFVGTLDEIRRDVATARELGVTEIIFAPGFGRGELKLEEHFDTLEQLRAVA